MQSRKHPFLYDLRHNKTKWLMLLPAAVVVILMCYIPMGGIVLAFKKYNYHDGVFEVRGRGWRTSSIFSSRVKPGSPQETPFSIISRFCA